LSEVLNYFLRGAVCVFWCARVIGFSLYMSIGRVRVTVSFIRYSMHDIITTTTTLTQWFDGLALRLESGLRLGLYAITLLVLQGKSRNRVLSN